MLPLITSVNLLVLNIDLTELRISFSRITNSDQATLLLRRLVRGKTSTPVPMPIGPVLPGSLVITLAVDINTDLMVVRWQTLTWT